MNLVQRLREIEQEIRQKFNSYHADRIGQVANDIEKAETDVADVATVVGQPEVAAVAGEAEKVTAEVAAEAEKLVEPTPAAAPSAPAEPPAAPSAPETSAPAPASPAAPAEVPPPAAAEPTPVS